MGYICDNKDAPSPVLTSASLTAGPGEFINLDWAETDDHMFGHLYKISFYLEHFENGDHSGDIERQHFCRGIEETEC